MTVGDRLRALREERQITRDELAAALHVSPSAVYAWEKGTVLPSLHNAIVMAEYYGISLDRLAGRERPPE